MPEGLRLQADRSPLTGAHVLSMPSTATVIIESFKDTAHIYRLAEYVNSGVITQGGLIVVDASAGAVTLDLPHTAAIDGRQFIIKKVDSTANTVTIRPSQTVGQR